MCVCVCVCVCTEQAAAYSDGDRFEPSHRAAHIPQLRLCYGLQPPLGTSLSSYICVLVSSIYVSSYHYMCPPHRYRSQLAFCTPLLRVLIPLYMCPRVFYMCPHTTIYVSSCPPHRYRSQLAFCTPLLRVLIPLYMCPRVFYICVLIPLYMCPRVLLIGTARSWRAVPHCSPAHPPGSRRALYGSLLRYSLYLLYWYSVYLLCSSPAHPVAGLCMDLSSGTQFTCFTGTNVQILTTVSNSFCHSVFPFVKTLQASAARRKCRNRL
jgi:hypothetical protein